MGPGSSQVASLVKPLVFLQQKSRGWLWREEGSPPPKAALGCWNTLPSAGQGDQRHLNGGRMNKQLHLETCPQGQSGSLNLGTVGIGAG